MATTKYIVNNLPDQTINGESILPTYKVYTALLTQSGGDGPDEADNFPLIIGTTYQITDNSGGADFTTAGSPNNEVGTYFVATSSIVNWGNDNASVSWNTGAPVVIVLENSLGVAPTYKYNDVGEYIINTVMSFNFNKIAFIFGNGGFAVNPDIGSYEGGNEMFFFTPNDNQLYNYPIEIRVYN